MSQVADDAVRGSLEAALQQQQLQYAECNGAPLTASVRTEEDAIQFTGRDFTFHRTTRQSLNLYGLQDTVSSYGDAISTITASMTDMGTDGVARDEDIASLRAALVGLSQNQTLQAAQLAAIAAAQVAPCIPYVEFTNEAGACVQLNRTCDTYRVPHYERARPTRTSDRQCTPKTLCNSAQYQSVRGSTYEDGMCAAVTNCSATGQVTVTPATAASDAICVRRVGLTRETALAEGCKELLDVSGFDTPSGFCELPVLPRARSLRGAPFWLVMLNLVAVSPTPSQTGSTSPGRGSRCTATWSTRAGAGRWWAVGRAPRPRAGPTAGIAVRWRSVPDRTRSSASRPSSVTARSIRFPTRVFGCPVAP